MIMLGGFAGETERQRLDRQVLLLGGALMSMGGLVWGSMCAFFALWGPSAIPFGYVVLTAMNFAIYSRTRNFVSARIFQVLISLLLPFFFQWSLGGFANSGCVMLWSMIALVGSLTFASVRETIAWLVMFCALTLFSGLIDGLAFENSPFVATPKTQLVFFVLNVVFISCIVFGLATVLNQRQRNAIAALELETNNSRELTAALDAFNISLEQQVSDRTHELMKALDDAKSATRAKTEFLAVMSHEIRTPLNGILGTADWLQTSPLEKEQSESVRVIRRSGELLLSILNDVLDFSKIEVGKLELDSRVFDPRDELKSMAALHRASATAKGVALEVEVQQPFPSSVKSDPDRLIQVIGNLLGNSVKFTTQGRVVITARATREGAQWRLDFAVTDNGIGMSPEVQSRLFKPFMQADASHTRRYGGSGLGLSICARLVQAMGGEISATSEAGVGSTFSFYVMVEAVDEAVIAIPVTLADAPSGVRVLLVEDNPVNVMIATRLLQNASCVVTVAGDGIEAVEAARWQTFDLILMDVQMPRLDGLGATQQIRALPLARQPFIAALSANAYENDREACSKAGMDDFLSKPLRVQTLAELLTRLATGVTSTVPEPSSTRKTA